MGKRKSVTYLARGSLFAALYLLLTLLSGVIGLASGPVQFRLSESLAFLPIFFPEAIAGLGIGCFLSNLLLGANVADLFLGTLATVLGALGTRLLRRVKFPPLATLPTVIANIAIIPLVIIFFYEGGESLAHYPTYAAFVALGEVATVSVLGTFFCYGTRKILSKNAIQ